MASASSILSKLNPATPNLRGLSTNYSNDGQKDIGGVGLGDLFELTYDRGEIEKIFNQGTDAAYALKQKENQIAQNQYANNQFAQQQSAVEALRQQRNSQIASGMARGLNAAQEQGTILGVQQQGAAGALELANERQVMADEIAAEYAQNVITAMQESNAVKQAMANVSSALYEADMMGYTGELSAVAQKYGADKAYQGALAQAAATRKAAEITANAAAASNGVNYAALKASNTKEGKIDWEGLAADLAGQGLDTSTVDFILNKDPNYSLINNVSLWEKAIDGNNKALDSLGVSLKNGKIGLYSDAAITKAVKQVKNNIQSGAASYSTKQQVADAIENILNKTAPNAGKGLATTMYTTLLNNRNNGRINPPA